MTFGFCTSLCDGFPGEVLESEQTGDGLIGNESFHGVMLQKVRLIPRAIGERWSDWLINSDVDVPFLRPVRALAERCLAEADICFQRDLLPVGCIRNSLQHVAVIQCTHSGRTK